MSFEKRLTILMLMMSISSYAAAQVSIDTRIGNLEFTHDFANGYPTDDTVSKLHEEMDFQRATQAYLWSLPLVSFATW